MQRASKGQGGKGAMVSPSDLTRTSNHGVADFMVSSSLPPMVMGTLAGEIEVSVPYLYPKPGVLRPMTHSRDGQDEPLFAVRVKWWGDSGAGTLLKPEVLDKRDGKGEIARQAVLSEATCALFPVRCELDGLVTYLKDMVRELNFLNVV